VIGDLVWYDENEDGVKDESEGGIGGVTIYLYEDDGDGVFEPEGDDVQIATTISNEDWEGPDYGTYHFSDLPAGHYWVSIDPGGLFHTTPNPYPLIDLQPSEEYLDADFGLTTNGG
jgi:hypothetical protein